MTKTFYRAAGEPGQFYHSIPTARRLLQKRADKEGRSFDLEKWRVNRHAQYERVAKVAHIEPKAESNPMAKKAKKKKSVKRPKSKRNTSRPAKKRTAKRPNAARHSKKKKAPRKPNPTRALASKISQMKPGVFYDTTLSGAHVRMKRVGQGLVIRPKAKRK
jgi:hypothetical protein